MEFRDLKTQYQRLKKEIDKELREVCESAVFIQGKKVDELEQHLADYVGVKHCVTCGSGTDALQLTLMAWGIGQGHAVFTSDFTFFASAGAASLLGATPVFVDIEPETFNLCPDALVRAIERTVTEGRLKPKVIIPVDLFGQPADYPRLKVIAEKYDLKVLEDGAQGFGGSIDGKKACSFGDAATTSFFPAKPLGCYGDGGAIFTDDEELDTVLRSLGTQGRSPVDKYDNQAIGINSRLDTLQAAVLQPKLKVFVEYELESVNRVARWYTERLRDVVATPVVKEGFYSSWAQYTILLEGEEQRNALQRHLKAQEIPSIIYYPRGLHQQSAYEFMGLPDEWYPNTIAAAKRVLSLPIHPYLTEGDVEDVCRHIREFFLSGSLPPPGQSQAFP